LGKYSPGLPGNFFKTLKNRKKRKNYKINIFKHETKKENTVNDLKRKF